MIYGMTIAAFPEGFRMWYTKYQQICHALCADPPIPNGRESRVSRRNMRHRLTREPTLKPDHQKSFWSDVEPAT
jgi:hypothetical protein